MSPAAVRRVIVWTCPRSRSTAFERAFLQRDDTHVFHEPFVDAFYFGPERQSPRYATKPVQLDKSYDATLARLMQPDDRSVVLAKDMAYAISPLLDRPDALELLANFQHAFLIRRPEETIASQWRMAQNPRIHETGWTYFDEAETGYADMTRLFDLVTGKLGQPPVVLDADEIVAAPEQLLRAFCHSVGIHFDQKMLSWEAGKVAEFNTWEGWHDDAQQSTGFAKVLSPGGPPLPDELLPIIDSACVHYHKLHATRLRAPTAP